MAYDPYTGQDSTDQWGWGMSPDLVQQAQLPPAGPQNPSAAGVGDPGNDANQIQGWVSQFLGPDRHFTDQNIADLKGQPLDLVMHNIANSDEAQNYAKRKAAPPPGPAPAAAAPTSSGYTAPTFDAGPNLSAPTARMDDLFGTLKSLYTSGGGFNQDIVNRRSEAAREDLSRQRSSTLKNDRALLANRGLVGSGPEADALNYLDTNVGNAYKNAVSSIYANESQSADQRMLSALQAATGLSESEAANVINGYQAATSRGLGLGNLALGNRNADNGYTLGLGNLALGNMNAANNYNLGVGDLGLRRDLGMAQIDNTSLQQIQQLIDQLSRGANASAGGYF